MFPLIDQLAATIGRNTTTVSNYLEENGLPFPSFKADGPILLNLSPQAERARITAIDALQELLDLLQGPVACMFPKVAQSHAANGSKLTLHSTMRPAYKSSSAMTLPARSLWMESSRLRIYLGQPRSM